MKTRSNTQQMDKAAIEQFLKSSKVGTLSLHDNEVSYAIPLAYSYDRDAIYLTMGHTGRKADCIRQNRNVCFVVYWIPEGFGAPGKMNWTSVICDGALEHLTDPEAITRAVRIMEAHMGMPEGTWNNLLDMTLKNPAGSNFWRVNVTRFGGRRVEDEFVEFIED